MKRICSSILACVLLVACVFSLASCVLAVGPMTFISGKYETNAVLAGYELEFSPFGKVTVEEDPIMGKNQTYTGKYKVNSETKEITLTFEDSTPLIFDNGTTDFSYGTEDGVDYIKIGIVKFTAVSE